MFKIFSVALCTAEISMVDGTNARGTCQLSGNIDTCDAAAAAA